MRPADDGCSDVALVSSDTKPHREMEQLVHKSQLVPRPNFLLTSSSSVRVLPVHR